MRFQLHTDDIPIPESLEKAINHKVHKVEERLKRYHPDVAELEVRLEQIQKVKEFACTVTLRAFRDTLHAGKSAPELRVAVDKSFDALMRELDHYRMKVNKSLQSGA